MEALKHLGVVIVGGFKSCDELAVVEERVEFRDIQVFSYVELYQYIFVFVESVQSI
ncbi:hypothetical protein SERLA73DRAFT_47352 [Serpula lacrymans var. lacrymans S7.3]|uniref:Uncharacterized protein n=1 Tax=Serpula lacrymans var. lacrymans (strain S7.3) TaxID=936435 RepID=F8PLL0_SERL3|nr:hypothetical protein SERLA73DRAFT_47352 [Serpula lacrymans var. lacrymans S7.3]